MSGLFGVWDARGGAAAARLGEARLQAALTHLEAGGERRDLGALWVAAGSGRLEEREGRCAAWEGRLLRAGGELGPGREAEQDGHFALAWADPAAGRLRLTRDASAGERLFYLEEDGLVLFSSSVRPLLAASARGPRVHRGAALEQLLQGLVVFGEQTLFEGVREVPPGHCVEFAGGRRACAPAWPGLLRPAPGSLLDTPEKLRRALAGSTAAAAGRDAELLVSLSGGIDSATVAALAVDLVGPERVSAVTYTFDDPAHVDEAPLAARVCAALGIRRHHVARIRYEDLVEAVPEAAWRMEDVTILSRARLVCLSRAIRSLGFDKALTGHGIEQLLGIFTHGGELSALSDVLRWLPFPDAALSHWAGALRPEAAPSWRERLHPGLKPPPPALFQFVVTVLARSGALRRPEALFPAALRPHARACLESEGASAAVAAVEGLPLEVRLQRLNYDRMILNRFFKGKTRFTREAGGEQVSPAMFLHHSAVSGHYWRRERSGRALLRAAMAGRLPAEVLERPKIHQQAVNPESWSRRLTALLRERLAGPVAELAEELGVDPSESGPLACELVPFSVHGDMVPYARGNLEALALWRRLLVAAPRSSPPGWDSL